MKELRLPLDFSPTLFKIINWHYIISYTFKLLHVAVNFGAREFTKFIAKYEPVSILLIDCYMLQSTLVLEKWPNLWQNMSLYQDFNWPASCYMLQSTLVLEKWQNLWQNMSLYQDFNWTNSCYMLQSTLVLVKWLNLWQNMSLYQDFNWPNCCSQLWC